jgi:hypothetical protein
MSPDCGWGLMHVWVSPAPVSIHPCRTCDSRLSVWTYVARSDVLVVRWCVVFSEIVGQVGRSWPPIYIDLFLLYPVLDPIESHLHGFGFLLFDLFVGKTVGGGVVNLYRGGWLGVSHFAKGVS